MENENERDNSNILPPDIIEKYKEPNKDRSKPMPSSIIQITSEESKKHGMYEANFSIDLTGTAFSASKFLTPDSYLKLSGPPGGPLFVEVCTYTGDNSEAGLIKLIQERFNKPFHLPVLIEPATPFEFGGKKFDTVGFIYGQGMMRTEAGALLVPLTEDGSKSLFILFGHDTTPIAKPDFLRTSQHKQLEPIIKSFKLQ